MLGLTVGLQGAGISQTLPALQYISQESANPCLLSSTFPAKGTYLGSPTHPLFVLPPSQIVCKMLRHWPHYSSRFRTILVGGTSFGIWKYPQNQQVSVILPEKPIVEVQLQLPGVDSFKAGLRNSEVNIETLLP